MAKTDTVLGRGFAGTVYRAHDEMNDRWVAVKIDDGRTGSLLPEIEVYKALGRHRKYIKYRALPSTLYPESNSFSNTISLFFHISPGGVPDIYYTGPSYVGRSNMMAMQLLGKSLAEILRINGGTFSKQSVCKIALQMVGICQSLVSKIYI